VVNGGCDLQRRSTELVAPVLDAFHRRLERLGKPLDEGIDCGKPSLEALTRRYGAAKALLAESREAHDFLTGFNVGRLVTGVLPW
jgi:hypothetical protein